MSSTSDYVSSWARAWCGCGAGGDGETLHRELATRYAEPHRKYHTTQHLAECLTAFESVKHLPPHPAEVELALWFHDAIYDVKRSDNEARSAEWAKSALLEGGAAAEVAERVHALIMATRHDAAPTTPDEKVLIDIDLSILGAGEARFAEYERQIREEYGFVPDLVFKVKRRRILLSFLQRPAIFSTRHFHDCIESAARTNLARAIG
jgi:predicted metal-dependent HD superfamily phosphohydrolase